MYLSGLVFILPSWPARQRVSAGNCDCVNLFILLPFVCLLLRGTTQHVSVCVSVCVYSKKGHSSYLGKPKIITTTKSMYIFMMLLKKMLNTIFL